MKTLREIIDSDFDGFKREKLEFWCPEDLPVPDWSADYSSQHCQRFSKGEHFEEIALRTWICTDTRVGLYAIMWNNELIALTYQGGRKGDRRWSFVTPDGEKKMWKSFISYAEAEQTDQCEVIDETDEVYSFMFDPDATYDWQTGPAFK
jgi:hypothetical protein